MISLSIPFDGHLDSFYVFTIVDCATINIVMQVAFSYADCIFFKYIPRSKITGSHSRSFFSCLSTPHTNFHSGYSSLDSHHQWSTVPFSSHPCQ